MTDPKWLTDEVKAHFDIEVKPLKNGLRLFKLRPKKVKHDG